MCWVKCRLRLASKQRDPSDPTNYFGCSKLSGDELICDLDHDHYDFDNMYNYVENDVGSDTDAELKRLTQAMT